MITETIHKYLPSDPLLYSISILAILLFISILAYFITEKIILNFLTRMFRKTNTNLDDILLNRKVFNRLAYLIPALLLYNFSHTVPNFEPLIQKVSLALIAISALFVINAFLNALNDMYETTKYSKRLHIKSYVQITKLIINLFCFIVIIAILIGKNPTWLLSGLGAMTAVILLIFKDTILSLVASIQINSNDLFKVGDWLEAPQFAADGDVIDIALHTVKIQNWDKTISIIPTHKLIDSAFRNWRGMAESGGRRIKRSLVVDINSIKLCDSSMLDQYSTIKLLNKYIKTKQVEIKEYNKNINLENPINGRQLTNIGTFRAYIKAYLENNQNIHSKMTFLVRQLEPTKEGLPIQIYVFSNDTDWIKYEEIQADIFDHLLAVAPKFGLKIFQNPSGNDLNNLIKNT